LATTRARFGQRGLWKTRWRGDDLVSVIPGSMLRIAPK
jgi:hypothetical protein